MSIINTKIHNIAQDFKVPESNKSMYGEVRTDFKLIESMFSLLPKEVFTNPNLKWCDPCCGNGYFTIYL